MTNLLDSTIDLVEARDQGHGMGCGANSVLGKARLILEAFNLDDYGLSLTELSRRTGISKASVYRLAQELLDWGMLERNGLDYRLGMRAFELGARAPRFRVLRDAVRPFMESLHQSTRETVHLGVLDGLDVLYLEKIASTQQAARPSRIAGRLPLYATATGKVILAHSHSSLFTEVMARGPVRISKSTIVVPALLHEQLRMVRARGYATESEEITAGYCSVAVPLFDECGVLLAALSVTAPTFRADTPRFLTELNGAVQRIRGLLPA